MARPDQLALIAVVYAIGVLIASAHGRPLDDVLLGLFAVLSVATALHYANEYVDYETDALTTRTQYSGGSGTLQAVGLGPAFARKATIGAAGLAVVAITGAAVGGLPPSALGLLSLMLVLGLAYSLPPQLAWRGFGEMTNALLGGLVLPLYGMATVGYAVGFIDVLTFLPFTAVVFVNLLATQWPDRTADAAVGKHTLAVLLSERTLRRLYVTGTIASLAGLIALVAVAVVPIALLGLSTPTFLLLAIGARRYGRVESPATTVHAMVLFAVAHVIAAACVWS